MVSSAAASYALALADVAKANNTLDATTADIEKIEEIFSDPGVFDFFNNPTVDTEKKQSVIEEIATSSSLQPHTRNFLYILVDAKRIDLINEITKEYEFVYNTLTDTEMAVVSSVVKLESQHLAQIAKQVQKLTGAKNVRIKTVIDPSLVAGFTIRYGNSGSKLIDMSVKKQLEEIAAQLDLGDITLTCVRTRDSCT
ncbi:ATP synthase delta chain, chloroplastic-like [Senna tora]|uniref:ATP synthase delta chain, chloroplastic-like n=1 Tax=Senna tora TaxID=362788 RepID=A0A835CEY4_9FABA|nr:ATP synthase delta chain, chloroplastic-like [Senna tora]